MGLKKWGFQSSIPCGSSVVLLLLLVPNFLIWRRMLFSLLITNGFGSKKIGDSLNKPQPLKIWVRHK